MCPYISSGNFSVPAPCCSRVLLHNLQPTSDRRLISASYLATGMILAIAIISRLPCLQGTRGSFKNFLKNALLSFCRNKKSVVHVPYQCRVIDVVLLCPSSHTWIQEFYVINPSVLLQDLHHALVRYLILLLVCATLYVITFTPSFKSLPECAHSLSSNTCKPIFMFLHLILCCPSSNCISHAIMKCRITILISCFPCLTARFFPREDCSIRPLAPFFAYLRIWNSLIRPNVCSLIRRFSWMRFYFGQEGCCPRCNPLS